MNLLRKSDNFIQLKDVLINILGKFFFFNEITKKKKNRIIL